jgi:pantothenate synthetase
MGWHNLPAISTYQQKIGEVLAECLQPYIVHAREHLRACGFSKVDYVTTADPATLQALTEEYAELGKEGRLLGAAWFGRTRLIDNMGFMRSDS